MNGSRNLSRKWYQKALEGIKLSRVNMKENLPNDLEEKINQ